MSILPQVLMDGIVFGESPRWHDGRLWFCDWGAHELVALAPGEAPVVVARIESFPFCIAAGPDGRLLVVSAADRQLLRLQDDGSTLTHADLAPISGKPWNDIVVDGRGNAYVGNIGFDFGAGEPGPGLLALVTPDGDARQVAGDLAFPNGLAVTPDNATLVVAESYANRLTAFDIAADGGLSGRRVWAALGDGVPDGICLDAEGACWYADVPNRRCVRVAEGGDVLQTVAADRGCFACILGGPDRRTLFIVAREWRGAESTADGERSGQILSVEVDVPGAGWP
jgi:sugar lactone lactonase YvrE